MPSGRLVLKTVGVIKRPPGPGKSPCCQVGARPRQMSKSRQVVLSQPPAFRGCPRPPPARGSQMGPSGLRGGVASAKIFGGGSGPLAPGGGCPPALWFDRGTHTWAQIFGDPGGVLQFAPGPLPRARSAPRALPDAPPGMRAGAPTPDGRIRPTPGLSLRHRNLIFVFAHFSASALARVLALIARADVRSSGHGYAVPEPLLHAAYSLLSPGSTAYLYASVSVQRAWTSDF